MSKIEVLKVKDNSDSYTVKHRLFDLPFRMLLCAKSGHGKSNLLTNIISKLFCNSRKFLVNIVLLSQLYTHITPTIRTNSTVIFVFNTNLQSLEAVEADNNYLETKKQFLKMFRDNVKTKFQFLLINYSNEYADLYLDSEFKSIEL